jgi:hypothetical protein
MTAMTHRAIRRLVSAHLALLLLLVSGVASAQGLPPSLQEWMRCEQGCLSRSVDTSRLRSPTENSQDPRFAPENRATFAVKSYWVDAGKMRTFEGMGLPRDLRGALTRTRGGKQQVRLIVHPESEALYSNVTRSATRAPDLMATATASSRTLLVWPQGRPTSAFFAKVSLDKMIGGARRTVSEGETARSVGINNVLQLASRRSELPASFGFLPEVFSTIPRGMSEGGMIIRAIPPAAKSGAKRYVPLFSLYAQPQDGGRPMLAQMIRQSGQPASTFVRDKIIRPFAKQYLELAAKGGIIPEPHAQNVLIELDRGGQPTGKFVHRDFGGFNIDFQHRRSTGKAMPGRMPASTTVEADYKVGRYGTPEQMVGRNLDVFFYGGFVYNLDQNLKGWAQRGWIPKERLGKKTFKKMLAKELESQYRAQTSGRVRIRSNLKSVSRMVPGLRGQAPRGGRWHRFLRRLGLKRR